MSRGRSLQECSQNTTGVSVVDTATQRVNVFLNTLPHTMTCKKMLAFFLEERSASARHQPPPGGWHTTKHEDSSCLLGVVGVSLYTYKNVCIFYLCILYNLTYIIYTHKNVYIFYLLILRNSTYIFVPHVYILPPVFSIILYTICSIYTEHNMKKISHYAENKTNQHFHEFREMSTHLTNIFFHITLYT